MTSQESKSRTPGKESVQEEYIVRFDSHQRIQHFLMMSAFITLALTGFPQKFPDISVSQWWVNALGGLRTVRAIHRGAGFVMLAVCIYHLAWVFVRIGVQRRYGAFRMVPTLQDGRDAVQMFGYYLGFASERPRFGRFSYLEKFDYWAVFWGIVMIGTSGVVLTFAVTATGVIPGDALPLLRGIHSDEAVLAVCWIGIVHMFNAHLAPWVFPFNPTIFTGKLSRERYAEDHPLEYAEIMSSREPLVRASEPQTKAPMASQPEAAAIEREM